MNSNPSPSVQVVRLFSTVGQKKTKLDARFAPAEWVFNLVCISAWGLFAQYVFLETLSTLLLQPMLQHILTVFRKTECLHQILQLIPG